MPIFKSTRFSEICPQKKTTLSTNSDQTLQHRFEKIMKQKKYSPQEEETAPLLAHTTHFFLTHNSNTPKKYQSDDARIQNSAITLGTKPPITSCPPPAFATNEVDSLRLRLTQGPLAGVILSATIQQGSLKLHLGVSEQKKLKKVAAQQEALHTLFGADLNMPLILEVSHEES